MCFELITKKKLNNFHTGFLKISSGYTRDSKESLYGAINYVLPKEAAKKVNYLMALRSFKTEKKDTAAITTMRGLNGTAIEKEK